MKLLSWLLGARNDITYTNAEKGVSLTVSKMLAEELGLPLDGGELPEADFTLLIETLATGGPEDSL